MRALGPALVVLLIALGTGCSDVPQRTGAMQLVDEQSPRTLRLVRRLEGSGRPKFEPVFDLTLPQAYYAYLDNHNYFKQTAIGLEIEKNTFEPLASVIAREQPIDHQTHTITGYYTDYVHRTLPVRITATDRTPASFVRQEAAHRERGQFVGSRWGFDFYHSIPNAAGNASDDLENFAGAAFHESGNLYVSCGELSPGCGVEFLFDGAEVHFVLRRHELHLAPQYRARLRSFLTDHISTVTA